jgi:hypothetical protein
MQPELITLILLTITLLYLAKGLALKVTPCPNHGGAYDCTPFCQICHGDQETKNN